MILSFHSVSPKGEIALAAANVPYANLQWTRRLSTCGSFEVQLACPLPVPWPGRYLVTADERDEVGVLEKVEAGDSPKGEPPTVSGRFAESLFDRYRFGADGGAARGANWRQAVTAAMGAWHMGDIPPLAMGAGTEAATGGSYTLAGDAGKTGMETIYAAAYANGARPLVSFDRDLDPVNLRVSLVAGADRTRSQASVPVQVFSTGLASASSVSYTGDYSCACSEVLAHAERGSDDKKVRVDRTVAVKGFDASTMWAQRAYEDVQSLIGQDADPTAASVDAAAALRACDHMPSLAIDVDPIGSGYLAGWDLGDTVEAEVAAIGLCAAVRVEEVDEVWKASGHTVGVTLGEKRISRMARALQGRR